MTQQDRAARRRPVWRRYAWLPPILAAAVLWPLAGFPVIPVAVAVAVLLVARILLGFLPGFLRRRRTLVLSAVLLALDLYLVTLVSVWAWLIVAGVALIAGGIAAYPRLPVAVPLGAAGLAAIVTATVALSIEHHQAAVAEQQQSRQEQQEHQAALLPANPSETLTALATYIARGNATAACLLFSANPQQDARPEFVHAVAGATSCPDAVARLHQQVTDQNEYPEMRPPAESTGGSTPVIDGCQASWDDPTSGAAVPAPGPKLGRLTVQKQGGGGYQIVHYEPCAAGQ
ncbi:hypothetical protein [Gandjariella thermophila]|uniref:Uncharacterized protein n=1 Tax=Gandjariella thermophila TaxID=1931992 RepID=A0A4D4J3P4_9PSEU|nr:hypothetical protein [Gandjariella thermophila]GDY29378.1 hypothetical protein GTS_10110 [Gandjariella thermophila]